MVVNGSLMFGDHLFETEADKAEAAEKFGKVPIILKDLEIMAYVVGYDYTANVFHALSVYDNKVDYVNW